MTTRKFKTLQQREQFKHLVLESVIQRLTLEETQNYIKSKMNIDVSIEWISKTKARLRKECKKRMEYLKKDDFGYTYEYFEIIHQIDQQHKQLWKIFNENKDRPLIQIKCLSELRDNTITLSNLYDVLPIITRTTPELVLAEKKENGNNNFNNYNIRKSEISKKTKIEEIFPDFKGLD